MEQISKFKMKPFFRLAVVNGKANGVKHDCHSAIIPRPRHGLLSGASPLLELPVTNELAVI